MDSDCHDNVPRGCLKMNDKIYPVFDGLNTVGRHPQAVVNIKHLNISKHHAIITIVDDNLQYISDFKSANGTFLNNAQLDPLQLYPLINGASIKFGDIFCTYKRLQEHERVDFDAGTQSFSESFYITNTQNVEILNSDEIVLNEMATQVEFTNSVCVNELPTQLYKFEESSDDSVDFTTMQKASESQAPGIETNPNDDGENVASQICPVKIGRKVAIQSDSESDRDSPQLDRSKSRYLISDDSETDIETQADSNTSGIDILEKNAAESHKNTEVDDIKSQTKKSTGSENTEETSSAKEVGSLNTDSLRLELYDENIDDALTQKLLNDGGGEREDLNLPPTQPLNSITTENLEKPNSDELCNNQSQILDDSDFCFPPAACATSSPKNKASTEGTDICLPPTQALEILHGLDKSETALLTTSNISATSVDSESDFIAPTQDLVDVLSKSPKKKTPQHDSSFSFQPTQALEVLHRDDSKFNQVEDQLVEIFATQETSLLGTQQLFDVLQTSRDDDVIDDSITDGARMSSGTRKSVRLFNFNPPKPNSVEAVTKILAEEEPSNNDDKKISQSEDVSKDTEGIENAVHPEEKILNDGIENVQSVELGIKSTNKRELNIDDQIYSKSSFESVSVQKGSDNAILSCVPEACDDVKIASNESTSTQEHFSEARDESVVESFQKVFSKTAKTRSNNRCEIDENQELPQTNRSKTMLENKEDEQNSEERLTTGAKKKGGKVHDSKSSNKRTRGKTKQVDMNITTKKDDKLVEIKSKETANTTRSSARQKAKLSQDNETASLKRDDSFSIQNEAKEKTSLKIRGKKVEEQNPKDDTTKKKNFQAKLSQDTGSAETADSKRDNSSNIQNEAKEKTSLRARGKEVEEDNAKEQTTKKKDQVNERKSKLAANSNTKRKVKESQDEVECAANSMTSRTSRKAKESEDEAELSEHEDSIAHRSTRTANKRKKDIGDAQVKPAKTKRSQNVVDRNDSQSSENSSTKNSRRKRSLKESNIDSEEMVASKVAKNESVRQSARRKATSSLQEPVSQNESETSSVDEIERGRGTRRLSAHSRHVKKELDKTKTKTVLTRTISSISNTSITSTPERNRRQQKPKVVFTMMDDPDLESQVRQLGGSVVDTTDACTVLITENVKRSQKLLCAVGQAKPICSPEWLRASKKSGKFLDPWDFILVDAEAEKKWNFSLRESLKTATATRLLENYTFQLIVNNAADVLKGAIEACGGKCVTRNLAKAESDHLFIVSSENNKSKFTKVVKQNPHIKVVEAEAIFDGTLRQEFKFNKHLLL